MRQHGRGHYELARPDPTLADLERVGRSYRERGERDRLKQQQVVEYAEARSCRWQHLLDDFCRDDDAPAEACGRCDRCVPGRFAPRADGLGAA